MLIHILSHPYVQYPSFPSQALYTTTTVHILYFMSEISNHIKAIKCAWGGPWTHYCGTIKIPLYSKALAWICSSSLVMMLPYECSIFNQDLKQYNSVFFLLNWGNFFFTWSLFPFPVATTVACRTFPWDFSGSMIPPLVFSSGANLSTSTRSKRGKNRLIAEACEKKNFG